MSYISFPTFDIHPLKAIQQRINAQRISPNKTIGILGGLGPQSTSLFYDTITKYCLERNLPAFPRLLINSVNTWEVTELLKKKDLESLYFFLKKEISLIAGQVDSLVMVCNSVHAVLDPLRKAFDIPILSIHEEVCKEIALSATKKIGILGTKTTIDNQFYQQELAAYGIPYVLQPERQLIEFDTCIFDEMLHGKGIGTMRKLILDGIEYMRARGCDGVILACTELPLFVTQTDTDMPLFLSTQILAQAVMEEYFTAF